MKKIFLGVYNPSIILTYISAFCSLYGIGNLLIRSNQDPFESLKLSMILLIVAGVCDMFDGKIARMCKRTEREKAFGIQLDSLADTVSFVVFPAVILMFTTGMHIISVSIAMFYIFAGIMRLGWFNVITEESNGYYYGLPVTLAALIFPTCFFIMSFLNVPFQATLMHVLYGATATAFILNFKFKKPRIGVLIALIGVALVVTLGIIFLLKR